jgi:hypothetical protein
VGTATNYQVWRATCPKGTTVDTCQLTRSITPTAPLAANVSPAAVCTDAALPNQQFRYCDGSAKPNQLYLYFVTATVSSKKSGASNQVKASH